MDGGLKQLGQLKEISKDYVKYYGIGLGLMTGFIIYTYSLYLLFSISYACECERINLATYLDTHLQEECNAYAENDYRAWVLPEEDKGRAGGGSLVEDPQALLGPSDILELDGLTRGGI